MTNKVSIASSDPILDMNLLQPQLLGDQRKERRLLVLSIVTLCTGTVLLDIFSPPVTTFTLFVIFAVVFSLLRLVAKEHRSVDRGATKFRESEFTQPFVSIIIPAHNEESVIASTVENILAIDYAEFELLVVDDRSTDRTTEILRGLSNSNPRFRYYSRPSDSTPGKAAALNDGLRQTNGKLVAVFDADARVEPDVLTKMVPYFANPLVGAVQARKKLLNAESNYLTRCQDYEYSMDFHMQSTRDNIRGSVELRGNGMLLRRTALDEFEGFNEYSIGEDLDLTTRMHLANWDLRFAADAVVKEEGPLTLDPLIRQRTRWTEGCLLRYLENASKIFFHPKLALRTKFDACLFIFEFIAPVWLLTENVWVLWQFATTKMIDPPVLFAAPLGLVVCLYLIYASFLGIHQSEKRPLSESLKGTVMVYLYLTILWLPIVYRLMTSLLLNNTRNLTWYKTPRYGAAVK